MTILASTSINYPGIIPFGSSDPSVVFQSSLTSQAIIEGNSDVTGTLTSTGQTFDSVLGVICGAAGGGKFALTSAQSALLEVGGQISFEIESKFIAEYQATPAVTGTDGLDHTTNDYIISWAASDGGAPFGRLYVSTGDLISFHIDNSDTQLTFQTTNLGASRFKRITLSWLGSVVEIRVNGAVVKTGAKTTGADLFKNIYIGTLRGSTSAATNGTLSHYVRNLIVSNRPVFQSVHPSAAGVPFGGDSFANQAFNLSTDPTKGYDHMAEFVIEGYMKDRLVDINLINRGLSGSVANTTVGTEWLTATKGVAFLADLSPIKILQIGTNDASLSAGNWSTIGGASGFDTDYKAVITSVMATCDYLVIGNIPTIKTGTGLDTAAFASQTASVNSTIDSIAAWWDAANPARAGAVRKYDLFNSTGGESPDSDMFNGSWTGASDDKHLSSRGRKILGELIAAETYFFLNGA